MFYNTKQKTDLEVVEHFLTGFIFNVVLQGQSEQESSKTHFNILKSENLICYSCVVL